MKFEYKGKTKVVVEMTRKQAKAIEAIFDSFTDQVPEDNTSYGDCVKLAKDWLRKRMEADAKGR